ncbi:hypothetical protein IA57_06935 [Mangrovimonas yunxiaonensis]|uniref:Secretion system C-terminal sorting domain-containing protein n=1 Tax=Mangrovimonas yunxiaonensis TaxID=1197477 RepID=A0A084TLH1_9FLAO|nr:DUF5689 domain-containing protein [Mangrovimonas yunxiaonensis]KFB01557.1 hypothetical protein IA57_06935 [Mangrovimonas yunxiaonensis]GGH35972.1 hypothetical protein GCM10011364_02910 [Mangrovimonas yunxiaonensis]
MKKLYFLFTFLIGLGAFAQSPIITTIVDGDCSGGNPKLLEIYADGAVDFSLYSLENQTNANTTWGNTEDLSSLGTVVDDFVYITTSGSADAIISDFPSLASANVLISNTINVNGDDRIRIIETATTTVIDQYGAEGVDGSGQSWEYADSYATRINGSGPDGGFIASNWNFGGAGALDGLGICQGGTDTFETLIGGVGVYTTTGSTNPSLAIVSPSNGEMFIPGTTSVNVSLNVQNFVVGTPGAGIDGHIHWTLDSGSGAVAQPMKYDTNDEPITVTNGGSYTVYMELVDNNHNPITPAVNTTVTFSVADINVVADITALLADVTANGDGRYYEITGSSLVSHTDGFRNRKWIQDNTVSGILIYDQAGTIATTYNVGDMVSGLKGYTQEVSGVLRFIPTEDSGSIDSSGNTVTPQLVTIADLNANPDDYESELVALQNVSFVAGDGVATFDTGQNYDVTDGTNTIVKRTDFFGADYINELIPSGNIANLTAVAGEFNGTAQIYVRNLNDITLSTQTINAATAFNLYPNPTNTGYVTIASAKNSAIAVEVYNILGKQVLNSTLTNNNLNVSALAAGMYILKISQDGASTTKKLVIK